MKFFILLAIVLGALMNPISASEQEQMASAKSREQLVLQYVAAFNARDTEAMLAMVTDDVQWLSVAGQKISVETSNKAELGKGMREYFKSCQPCKSRIANIFSTGSRVSALEVASFETKDGLKNQQSLSVYEFSGSLIRRVYYFPVEKE